jgi:hypothetical protein
MKKLIFANIVLATMAIALLAQNSSADRALVVNGKPVSANVIQREGHFYVNVEALVLALGGAVTLETNQIVVSVGQQSAEPGPESAEGLSKEFQRTSNLALGDMSQWVGAIGTLIVSGYPVTGEWPRDYHDRVDHDLKQAATTASTNADREALQLLQTHSVELAKWADNVVAERKALDAARFVDPNALQNDRVRAKIIRCGEFLSSMIVRGIFADDSSCH